MASAAAFESREVTFRSGGYELRGTLTVPAGKPPLARVLIIGGSGPVDRDGTSPLAALPPIYRQWGERLADTGVASLRYDKRFLTYPDIDIASFDEEAQLADAAAALSHLRSRAGFADAPIFILGHSEGGTLAPLLAERAGAVAGAAVVNTVQFPVDELLLMQLQGSPQREETERLLAQVKAGTFPARGLLLGAGAAYWRQWIKYSTESPATLLRLEAPVLLVQCLQDETLPGRALARNTAILRDVAARKANARLHELPRLNHFAMVPGTREPSPEFIQALSDWLINEARAVRTK